MKNPRVSVIVPNYNHALFLPARLDSIIGQSYKDFEIILLDDCSTDNSREIIESYRHHPKVSHVLINDFNTGNPFLQWDKGIEIACGEFIWIAESDDIAHVDFLSTLVKQMDCCPDAVLAFSHSFLVDGEGVDMHINKHSDNTPGKVIIHDGFVFASQKMSKRNDLYNASMVLFRRSIYDLIGKHYQSYRSCGDWAFWMSACLQGKVVEVCSQLNYYRQHPTKVTTRAGQTGKDWEEVAKVLQSFISQLHLSGFALYQFRGQWTKHFRESHYTNKAKLKAEYPDVFGGTEWDVLIYKIGKIKRLFDRKHI